MKETVKTLKINEIYRYSSNAENKIQGNSTWICRPVGGSPLQFDTYKKKREGGWWWWRKRACKGADMSYA